MDECGGHLTSNRAGDMHNCTPVEGEGVSDQVSKGTGSSEVLSAYTCL